MAVIGTFSSFTTARLAIYASQASLNVTGNNIANINTQGYTRQRMDLVSLYSYGTAKFANIYNTNIGYGVLTNGATQLRDPYLDIRYRDENCKLGQNTEWLDGLTQMGRILDEVGKGKKGFGVIEAQLGTLKDALQDLSNKLDSTEYDDLVRMEANTLATYFNSGAKELQTIWDNKKMELGDAVNDVNKLLTDIRDLNDKIRTQAIYKDKALELRDARNLALDKLSEYMHINVEYSMERIDQFTEVEKLTVTLADSKGPDGKPIKLVDGIYGAQISIQDKEPAMNPDADAMKILEAMDKARVDAEAKNAKDQDPWKTKFEEAKTKATADATPQAEANNDKTKSPWKEKFETAIQKAGDEAQKAAEKEFKDDPDKDAKIAEAVQKAKDEAEAKVEAKRQEAVKAEVDAEVKKAERAVERDRQQAIEDEVANSTDVQDAIAKYGKYLEVGADGKVTGATNELYKKDKDGVVQVDEKGNPIYRDEVKTYPNDKFLLQVEPLKDERDRLMVDPYTVTKRSEVVELDDTVLTGKIQAIREMLTEEGEYASAQDAGKGTEDRLSDDPNAAIKRGIPYYQKALDSLAQKIADTFNKLNQMPLDKVYQMSDDQFYVDPDGNIVGAADPGAEVQTPFLQSKDPKVNLTDANGKLVTKERLAKAEALLADKTATPEEQKEAYEDYETCMSALRENGLKDPVYGFYDGGVLFSNNGNTNDPSGITAKNIAIAIDWAEGPVRILNSTQPDYYDDAGNLIKHSSLNDNILHMINVYDQKLDYFAKDIQPDADNATQAMFSGSFREVFTALSGTLADDAYATDGKVNSYELMTLDLENDRQSVSGVDLNEEATSMMQFSKSYAAACKLLTTLDSMLDKLINGTI